MNPSVLRFFAQLIVVLLGIYGLIFVFVDTKLQISTGEVRTERNTDGPDVKNYACVKGRKREKSKWSEGTHYPNQLYYEYIISKKPASFVVRKPAINPDTKVIILVLSKNTEEEVRRDIRSSWASPENPYLKNQSATVIFVVGDNDENLGCLQNEANQHEDLLIVRTLDSYRGLVYKLLMAFQYLSATYPRSHLIKIDRDCILDVSRMMEFMAKQNRTHFIYGYLFYGAPPVRQISHMWYVPESVFNGTWYPWYVNGNFYIISAKGLIDIMAHRSEGQVIEIEDLFFTGILRQKANVSISWLKEYKLPAPSMKRCPTKEQRALFAHGGVGDHLVTRYENFIKWRDSPCEDPKEKKEEDENENEDYEEAVVGNNGTLVEDGDGLNETEIETFAEGNQKKDPKDSKAKKN